MKQSIFMRASILAVTALLIATGCTKGKDGEIVIHMKQQSGGKTLAQVGKINLNLESLREDFLQRQGQFRGAPNLNNDKTRNDFVESQVMQKAMFLDAIEQNYFDLPEVRRDVEKIVVQRLMRNTLEKAQETFVPTEEKIKEHYEKNPNLYNREEAIKVAYISIPFGNNKDKTQAVANLIHKDAVETVKNSNSKAFNRLAMKYAEKFGGLGNISVETNETDYLDKNAFESKFGAGTFAAVGGTNAIGHVVPVTTTEKGFLVMLKTGYRKAMNETLEEARPKITKRLAYDSRGDFFKEYKEQLMKKYDVKIIQELVAELSNDPEGNKVAQKNNNNPAKPNETKPNEAIKNQQAQANAEQPVNKNEQAADSENH
jgi:hypothetical protein